MAVPLPLSVKVRPFGTVPPTRLIVVTAGEANVVSMNELATPTTNDVVLGDVKTGPSRTVSTKLCVADSVSLVAVSVNG